MDSKQIITLAVIFVAGLVLGNLAGNVTGYGTKTIAKVTLDQSTITLDPKISQSITLNVDVTSGKIRKQAKALASSGAVAALSNNLCSTYCGKGTYSAKIDVSTLAKGTYSIQVEDASGNSILAVPPALTIN